jgi:hypothetical protein
MIPAMQGGKGNRMWREEQVKKRSKRNPATTKTRQDKTARPPKQNRVLWYGYKGEGT